MENLTQEVSKQFENFKIKQEEEFKKLKSHLETMNERISKLEKQNTQLIKENNNMKVKKYGQDLLNAIIKQDFHTFKKIIVDEHYPLEEYFFIDDEYSVYNILLLVTKLNLTQFIEYIIDQGVEINCVDKEDHWTPLMYSVENKNIHIAKLLLQKGADINKKDVDGFSCLMIAIDCNDSSFCKLLLDYKPIIENPNNYIEMLESYGNREIENMLKKYFFEENKNNQQIKKEK